MKRAEWIYETMMGEMEEAYPGVDNAFAPGEKCEQLYAEIYEANQRLCQRLGAEEDADVEIIINSFFKMNRELCMKMYFYGMLDGVKDLSSMSS